MLLTAFNLSNYILQQKWKEKNFNILSNIFSSDYEFEIANIDKKNIRNTVLNFKTQGSSFIFKQPKFTSSGTNWQIISEAKFYSTFKDLTTQSTFDKNYHILILNCLDELSLNMMLKSDNEFHFVTESLFNLLAKFHSNLEVKGNKKVKSFIRNNSIAHSASYINFYELIKKGRFRYDFLDEVVFPAMAVRNMSSLREVLYHFLHTDNFFNLLYDFSEEWEEDFLIHGDAKADNILIDSSKNYVFADFELVSKGDNAWDVACLLESVLYTISRQTGYESVKGHAFFKAFMTGYQNKMEISGNKSISFTKRVMKFWALRQLERFRMSTNLSNKNVICTIIVIGKLFLQTDKYFDYLKNDKEEKLELFDYNFKNCIFKNHG